MNTYLISLLNNSNMKTTYQLHIHINDIITVLLTYKEYKTISE